MNWHGQEACAARSAEILEYPARFGLQGGMLSQKAKYAIKALIALAQADDGQLLQASDISHDHNIPKKFLDLIFFELRGHRMVDSTRGRQGGYALAMPPENITLAAVIRAVDGALAPLPCASVRFYRRCADCKDEKTCAVRKLMREVRDATSAILDNTTLAEAAGLGTRKASPVRRARQRA
jgi:Rrf2 family protein